MSNTTDDLLLALRSSEATASDLFRKLLHAAAWESANDYLAALGAWREVHRQSALIADKLARHKDRGF
jgi:hypothetical protein